MESNAYQSPEAKSQSTAGVPEAAAISLGQAARRGAKKGAIYAGIATPMMVTFAIVVSWYIDATTIASSSVQTFDFALKAVLSRIPDDSFAIVSMISIAVLFGAFCGALFEMASVWSQRKQKRRQ